MLRRWPREQLISMRALQGDNASEEGKRSAEHKKPSTFEDKATHCVPDRYPCIPHAWTRCVYSNATSTCMQRACNTGNMGKYASRCDDRSPVTIPGHGLATKQVFCHILWNPITILCQLLKYVAGNFQVIVWAG